MAWDTPSGRGELCQGSVVCVMCSRLLCPYLVCFLSLFDVIISLFLSSRVCLIVYDYPLYISPVCSVRFGLVYSLLPGVSVHVSHVLSCLDVSIKDYYFSLGPRLRVPVSSSCVHRDTQTEVV